MQVFKIKMALVFGIVILSSPADAFERKRVEMKCYVELLGGTNVIHYATMPEKKTAKLEKSLVNRKIVTVGNKDKQVVNKVIECVESQMDFKNLFAKELQKRSVH